LKQHHPLFKKFMTLTLCMLTCVLGCDKSSSSGKDADAAFALPQGVVASPITSSGCVTVQLSEAPDIESPKMLMQDAPMKTFSQVVDAVRTHPSKTLCVAIDRRTEGQRALAWLGELRGAGVERLAIVWRAQETQHVRVESAWSRCSSEAATQTCEDCPQRMEERTGSCEARLSVSVTDKGWELGALPAQPTCMLSESLGAEAGASVGVLSGLPIAAATCPAILTTTTNASKEVHALAQRVDAQSQLCSVLHVQVAQGVPWQRVVDALGALGVVHASAVSFESISKGIECGVPRPTLPKSP
jgi:hypothetical protein